MSTTANSPQPKVSVITVVFNNAKTIAKCIESVISQDYPNIEYIVIDGGSTDGTQSVIERYRSSISVYISEKDGGIYDAMNKGLSNATGDVISFLNSDDFYFPDAVSSSIRNLQENNCDLSYAGFYYADEAGYAVIADEARPWDETLLLQGIPGGHETIFAKRSVYETVGGFDLSYRLAADYQWVTRVFKSGFKACAMPRTILVMMPGGASFNEGLEYSENKRILEENFGAISPELFEKLYNLKFYKNWHGRVYSDRQAILLIEEAKAHSSKLARVTAQVIKLRKIHLRGNIRPLTDPHVAGKRILIALNYLSGINGGAERIAVEQANELHARGYQVTVVSCSGIAGQPYYKLNSGIPHIDLSIPPYKWHYERKHAELHADFGMWAHLRFPELNFAPTQSDFEQWLNSSHLWYAKMYASFLIEHDFDIVLAHMPSTYPYLTLLNHHIREARPNLRIVSMLHNSPTFKFYSKDYPAENLTDRFMRLATLHASDRIGILFEEFRPQMPKSLQSKCVVIPNFTTHQIREIDPKRREKIIIAVGRLVPQKDHSTLLRAYAMLRNVHPDWGLRIYGDGPLKSDLFDLAKELGLDPNRIFQGSKANIQEYYETASIFAFPSLFEGFGLVLIEAMAAGLPAVGFSDCEGVKYIIQSNKNGILVDGSLNREAAMFDALRRLIDNPRQLQSFADNAPARANDYSLASAIDTLEMVIAEIAPRRTSIPRRANSIRPTTKYRTLILTSYTSGGAGIAAMRLHRALLSEGHDSWVLSFSTDNDERVFTTGLSHEEYSAEITIHPILAPLNRKPLSTIFSPGVSGLSKDHFAFFEQFDVINIHWVAGMLRYDLISSLSKLGKPIVWTLHDMNPLTGGCHYSGGCLGYRSRCEDCPQLVDSFNDFPEAIRAMKAGTWPQGMAVVSPSNWLAKEAKSSTVFRNNRVVTIPNSLDLEVFRPADKRAARISYGLPDDKKILLFSSLDNNERRKGFPELLRTAEILASRGHEFHIVSLGRPNEALAELNFGYSAMGYLTDPADIARLLSAADVTVLPTLEDNLPNVILESIACGTPVAAFDAGGVRDAVKPGISGELAPLGDVEALADCIERLLAGDLSAPARRYAELQFEPKKQAAAYVELFETLVSRTVAPGTTQDGDAMFELSELKHQRMATTLSIARRDIDYLKKLCDELRAEIVHLRETTHSPNPGEETELASTPDFPFRITEEMFFGSDGFINIRVNSSEANASQKSHFYLKLWSRYDGVVVELRENDGAFSHIPNLQDLDVNADAFGRVVYLPVLDHSLTCHSDLGQLPPGILRVLRALSATIARTDMALNDAWKAIADALRASGLDMDS